jgi:hypothetical protein
VQQIGYFVSALLTLYGTWKFVIVFTTACLWVRVRKPIESSSHLDITLREYSFHSYRTTYASNVPIPQHTHSFFIFHHILHILKRTTVLPMSLQLTQRVPHDSMQYLLVQHTVSVPITDFKLLMRGHGAAIVAEAW